MNKFKKMLCGGLVLASGLALTTGCAVEKLYEEKMNSLIQGIESIGQQLDENLKLVKLEKEQISAKEAYELFQRAKSNIIFNNDNIKDNLVIKEKMTDPDYEENYDIFSYFYRDSSGEYYYSNDGDGWEEIIYEEDDKVYNYYRKGEKNDLKQFKERTVSARINNNFDRYIFGEGWSPVNEEDIVNVEINDEGNCTVTFLKMRDERKYDDYYEKEYDEKEYSYTEITITKDAKFLNLSQKTFFAEDYSTTAKHSTITKKLEFVYGGVDKDVIFELLEEAKQFNNQN